MAESVEEVHRHMMRCQEYQKHPLRKEYETKKEEILKKNKGLLFYLGWIFIISAWVMIPGYLVLFVLDDMLLNMPFLIIFLGIINLIIAGLSSALLPEKINKYQENRNKDEVEKLKAYYSEKGLFEYAEKDLFRHGCYIYDGGYCGITGERLYGDKKNFCATAENCIKCKIFMSAYIGREVNGDFEME